MSCASMKVAKDTHSTWSSMNERPCIGRLLKTLMTPSPIEISWRQVAACLCGGATTSEHAAATQGKVKTLYRSFYLGQNSRRQMGLSASAHASTEALHFHFSVLPNSFGSPCTIWTDPICVLFPVGTPLHSSSSFPLRSFDRPTPMANNPK